jgi:dihydroorotase
MFTAYLLDIGSFRKLDSECLQESFPVAFPSLTRLESPMSDRLTLLRPDDWHIHLRDGAVLTNTVAMWRAPLAAPSSCPTWYRRCATPLKPTAIASAFSLPPGRQPLRAADGAVPHRPHQPEEIREAKASGFVHAAKLYPAGATTNSDSGVTSIDKIFPALEAMAEVGMPLLIHGEVTRGDVDVFDRESASSMSTCAVWSSVSRR